MLTEISAECRYVRPCTSVPMFHAQFPLPLNLFKKLKDGIRLWPTMKHAKASLKHQPPLHEFIVRQLLKAHIIVKSKPGPFRANMFAIPKGNGGSSPNIRLFDIDPPSRATKVCSAVDLPSHPKD